MYAEIFSFKFIKYFACILLARIDLCGSFIYLFAVLNAMFLTAVRDEVNNLKSSVVIQKL